MFVCIVTNDEVNKYKCRLRIQKYNTHALGFLITLKQPDALIENFLVADTKLAAWILIR